MSGRGLGDRWYGGFSQMTGGRWPDEWQVTGG